MDLLAEMSKRRKDSEAVALEKQLKKMQLKEKLRSCASSLQPVFQY